MIKIVQEKYNLDGLQNMMKPISKCEINLDVGLLQEDLDRLSSFSDRKQHKVDKENIKVIKHYLYTLAGELDENDNIELNWKIDGTKIKSDPVNIMHFNPYRVRVTDYVNLNNKKMVHINYRDVLEIIAFEIMHRDLGETHYSMEEKLINVGITIIEPAETLLNIINDTPLDYSKFMKIENSPYATIDGKMSWDYFNSYCKDGNEAFTSGMYRDCVGRSVEIANQILLKSVITVCNKNKIKFSLCCINEDGIYLLVDNDTDIDTEIFESASVRAFGRRFEVIPKVEIY